MCRICCIFGAGTYYGTEKLPDEPFWAISADGGYALARKMGVMPDLHVGDFDSHTESVDCPQIVRLKPEKDDTDTLSAVRIALEHGCDRFYFYGCCGGRTAHTFANLQTLAFLAKKGCHAWMYGDREIFRCICNGKTVFSPDSSGYISVYALTDSCVGVSESGLKYKTELYTMKNDFPIGTSNEFIGEEAVISVQEGVLLLIYTDKAKEIV